MSIDLSEQTLLLQIWIASLVLWGYIKHSNIAILVSIVSVFGFECWTLYHWESANVIDSPH